MKKRLFTVLILVLLSWTTMGQQLSTQHKKAIKLWSKAITNYQQKAYDTSMEYLNKCLKYDPNFLEVYYLKADIYAIKKVDNLLIDALNKAIQLEKKPTTTSYFMRAKAYQRMNNYHKAIEDYTVFKTLTKVEKQRTDADFMIKSCLLADSLTKKPVAFNPVNLGSNVNSPLNEYWPSLTIDNELLVFTRRLEFGNSMHEDFYYCTNDSLGWLPAQNMGSPMNTLHNEGAQSISADGKLMVYTVCKRRGDFGSCDLYASKKVRGAWQTPRNMGSAINTRAWESQPSLTADGKTLYFVSNRSGGFGKMDIWVSHRDKKGQWSAPHNLGATINTSENETAPFIHPDGVSLYFASRGHLGMGEADIFKASRTKDNWINVQNMGYPINTTEEEGGLITNAKGDIGYIASTRKGGYGGLDMYSFTLPEDKRPTPVTYVKGIVFDAETLQKLQAKVELVNLKTNESTVLYSNTETGDFLLILPINTSYSLNVRRKGYLFYSDHFDLVGDFDQMNEYELSIGLKPIKYNETIILKNVFFDTDKYILKSASHTELLRLVALLKSNPSMKIEISGHTDNQGDDTLNLRLSDNRAKAVKTFLINKGIATERLSHKGYGKNKPIATNDTPEGRGRNRRTEVQIVK